MMKKRERLFFVCSREFPAANFDDSFTQSEQRFQYMIVFCLKQDFSKTDHHDEEGMHHMSNLPLLIRNTSAATAAARTTAGVILISLKITVTMNEVAVRGVNAIIVLCYNRINVDFCCNCVDGVDTVSPLDMDLRASLFG